MSTEKSSAGFRLELDAWRDASRLAQSLGVLASRDKEPSVSLKKARQVEAEARIKLLQRIREETMEQPVRLSGRVSRRDRPGSTESGGRFIQTFQNSEKPYLFDVLVTVESVDILPVGDESSDNEVVFTVVPHAQPDVKLTVRFGDLYVYEPDTDTDDAAS